MNVKEIAELQFKMDILGCADPVTDKDLASGDARDTIEWFMRYSVDLVAQVSPFIPDRPPDAIDHDGHIHWWQLENGVILGRFGKDPLQGGGYIIPPDAQDPPPIRDFEWLDAELRNAFGGGDAQDN